MKNILRKSDQKVFDYKGRNKQGDFQFQATGKTEVEEKLTVKKKTLFKEFTRKYVIL